MEGLQSIMQQLQERTGIKAVNTNMSEKEYVEEKCRQYNALDGNLPDYDCDKCKNKGYIAIPEYNDMFKYWGETHKACDCQKTRNAIKRLEQSGLKDIVKKCTFEKYIAEHEWQQFLKSKAIEYAKNPDGKWLYAGGQSGCVDADTEYFNGQRWVRIADYQQGDKVLQYNPNTKEATLTYPERYIVYPATEMYKIQTYRGSINQVLSGNHNFAYITSKGHMQKKPFIEVVKAHEENAHGFSGRIETAFRFNGAGIDLTDAEIRIMCAVISDGYFKSQTKRCIVNVKKQRKKERMKILLESAGYEYKEYNKSNGYTAFKFYAPRREKEFNDYWYNCNENQLKIIKEEIFYWDGSVDDKGRRNFYSTVKKSADFVQFVLSATGTRATINIDNHKEKTCYVVTASKGNSTVSMLSSNKSKKTEITKIRTKDGKQYCFTVETGYLVLRRCGRIFITGNSGKTHLCTAVARMFLLKGKNVRYMVWMDESKKLKAIINDAESYNEQISAIKNADVLYIDDLFKTGKDQNGNVMPPTAADVQLAIEILNYRYYNHCYATIISSERLLNEITDIDEALGGRIAEMTGDCKYAINIARDKSKNYRLRNLTTL